MSDINDGQKELEKYAFLGWLNKYIPPKQTKLTLDRIETNSSVNSSGANETLERKNVKLTENVNAKLSNILEESNENCGPEIEEYDTQSNFKEQSNEPVLKSPRMMRNLPKIRIKKLNLLICNSGAKHVNGVGKTFRKKNS